MPDGTVRGTFDLNSDPAVRGLRSIRDTAGEADGAVRNLGGALDSIGGMQQKRKLDSTASDVRSIGTAASESRTEVAGLNSDLDELGRKRVTAHVSLSGMREARAELAALKRELRQFDHERATAHARIVTSGGGGAGAARAALAAGGGGGGAAGGLRAPPGLALAGLGLLPVVQALGGASIGVLGSAASGAAGAATVGAAGLGTLAVGGAPTMFAVKDYIKDVKAAETAQAAYNKTVQQYGAASRQAATSKARLDAVYAQNPGTRRAVAELNQLHAAAERTVLAPSRRAIGGAAGQILANVRTRALPTLAPGIRQDVRAGAQQATNLSGFLTQPNGAVMTAAVAMQHEFARDLPLIEHSLENVLTLSSNVARISLPYFHDANVWIEHQTKGWAQWSQDTSRVQTTLDHGVASWKRWRDLAGATFTITKDLLSAGRSQGDNTVTALTTQLNTWDDWIRRNPQKMQTFFREAWQSTKNIASAIWEIAKALGQVSNLLLPVLSHFAQLVSFAGGAGLLLPAAARAGMGYVLGRRDPAAAALRGGGGGGGAAGPAAMMLGGGAARVGGGTVVGGAPMASGYLVPSYAGHTVGGGTQALDTRSLMLLGSGRRTIPIGGPVAGPRGVGTAGMATPEAFAARYGDVPGARFAMPASEAGLRARGLGRIAPGWTPGAGVRAFMAPGLSTAGRGLRAVGGFVAPALAINALLSAAGTSGNFAEQAAGGVRGLTLGLVNPQNLPITGSEHTAAANSWVQGRLANLMGGADPSRLGAGGMQTRIGALQRLIGRTGGESTRSGLIANDPIAGALGFGDVNKGEHRTRLKQLTGELVAEQRQLRSILDQQAVGTAQSWSQHFGEAFNVYAKRMGPVKAMHEMTGSILKEMHTLRPAGQRVLAQNALSWANQMAHDNPKLKGQYEDLRRSIIAQFNAIGKHITIVNGQILDGSKTEWKSITQAMQDPLEQAKQKMQTSFTQIQQMALGSLQAMGLTRSQATNIVRGLDPGTKGQNRAGAAWSAANPKAPAAGSALVTQTRPHATGGRIPGMGLADTVKLWDGGYGAPGELIVNRHTEMDVNRDLMRLGRPTLDARVSGEKRAHSAPMKGGATDDILPDRDAIRRAVGGRLAQIGQGLTAGLIGASTGGPGQFDTMLATATQIASHRYPYRWGGGHDPHFSPPYDCSGAVSAVLHAGGALNSPLTSGGFMSFGQPGGQGPVTLFANRGHVYMRLGNRYWGTSGSNPGGGAGFFNGSARPGFVQRSVPVTGGGGAAGAAAMGFGGFGNISLHGINSGMGGVPGALANRGSSIYAAGLQGAINQRLARMGGVTGGPLPHGGGGNAAANMALGRQMMMAAGWGAGEWPALQALWQQESGWNSNSVNRSSGAYGIPQSLGHGHPYNLGDAGAQIAWGLQYIRQRYGSPSAAEAHERSHNWYATGGRMPEFAGWFGRGTNFVTTPGKPMVFGAGERGRERVRIEPLGGGGGGRTAHLTIHPGAITVQGSGDPEKVAEHVVTKIIEALDRGQTHDGALA